MQKNTMDSQTVKLKLTKFDNMPNKKNIKQSVAKNNELSLLNTMDFANIYSEKTSSPVAKQYSIRLFLANKIIAMPYKTSKTHKNISKNNSFFLVFIW